MSTCHPLRQRPPRTPKLIALSAILVAALSSLLSRAASESLPFPLIERFENFGLEQGLPAHKVHCVLPASDGRLWVGTYKGALVRQDGKFQRIGTEEGLTHPMVMCLAEDIRSGDMWIGTMRGL